MILMSSLFFRHYGQESSGGAVTYEPKAPDPSWAETGVIPPDPDMVKELGRISFLDDLTMRMQNAYTTRLERHWDRFSDKGGREMASLLVRASIDSYAYVQALGDVIDSYRHPLDV